MIEKYINMSEEEIKIDLNKMKDTDKLNLINEINEKIESNKAEKIRLETIKTKLEEDEKDCMKTLAEYNIHTYADLDSEILRLESEIDKSLIEYVNQIKGE